MIRFSRLNEAEHCGLSGTIEDHTTGEAAMRGDAFHALTASHYRPKEPRFQDAKSRTLASLSAEARGEVIDLVQQLTGEWAVPESANFEVPIGIDRNGLAVDYDSPDAISRGTADCVWEEGADTVVVVDFKSGGCALWNVPPPAVNLQVLGYGLAFADKLGKSKMRLGIYLAAENQWLWASFSLDSPELTAQWERVRGAALHETDEAVVGPHCYDCWVRLRCPAHLLPAVSEVDRESALAVMSEPIEGPIAPEKLLRLLTAVKAMDDLAEAGKDFAKAYVAKHGALVINGKQWGPIPVKGKELVSIKSLKEAGIYDRARAVGAVRDGEPSQQHRWTNAKGAA